MSEKTKKSENVVVEEEVIQDTANLFFDSARKAMNASLGAVDLAREEVAKLLEKTQTDVEEIFNNLVERGESFGSQNRQRIEEAVETRKTQAEEAVTDLRATIDVQVEKALHNINIPTKADIDDLSKKIANLTRKVNAMAKEK
ncbi:MAG: phasin family protein [Chloroflexota bacterium]